MNAVQTGSQLSLVLLTDGRLPDGAYTQSGGLEPVAGMGLVHDQASLEAFLRGRLHTAGLVVAALAARACRRHPDIAELEAATDARIPSQAARAASRKQGRQLLRAAARVWPSPSYRELPRRPHHPVTLGKVALAAGLEPSEAALAAAYGSVTGPAAAAIRLLSFDPLEVHATVTGLSDEVESVAAEAATAAANNQISAVSAPLLEIGAEDHATWEVRLFAS